MNSKVKAKHKSSNKIKKITIVSVILGGLAILSILNIHKDKGFMYDKINNDEILSVASKLN